MIHLDAERGDAAKSRADVVSVLVCERKNDGVQLFDGQIATLKKIFPSIAHALDAGVFTGKFQETLVLFPTETQARILLTGIGTTDRITRERLRRAAATAAKAANSLKAASLAFETPDEQLRDFLEPGTTWETVGMTLAEGATLSVYRFSKYRTRKEHNNSTLRRVSILCNLASRTPELQSGVRLAQTVCEGVYLARDLANAPANEIYPASLARQAQAAGRRYGFAVQVLDERRIRRLKMGGVLAVARGSDQPPRFIIMNYRPKRRAQGRVVLVGKGVTFDAGGISIKPAAGMGEMKMDMSGAAAVIATIGVAARLKLPLHIIGLVPAVENLLGGAAMKPGDIIRHLSGRTTEVDNTDAEGRLILADALAFASRYKPDLVIDLATLTGHVVVGLGHHVTGMMGNDRDVMQALQRAGERTYERVWELPMFEEYEKLIKSDVADAKNSGGRPAGAITAALFLKQHIGEYSWVHLDIAGTAILPEAQDYIPKGASGVGVRLLTEFLRSWHKHSTHQKGEAR